jgi:hypothetical protein
MALSIKIIPLETGTIGARPRSDKSCQFRILTRGLAVHTNRTSYGRETHAFQSTPTAFCDKSFVCKDLEDNTCSASVLHRTLQNENTFLSED